MLKVTITFKEPVEPWIATDLGILLGNILARKGDGHFTFEGNPLEAYRLGIYTPTAESKTAPAPAAVHTNGKRKRSPEAIAKQKRTMAAKKRAKAGA